MMASFHKASDQTRMTSRMSSDWITNLFSRPDMLLMGHHQRAEDHNLGTGWLYYALARIIRPSLAVVIGSWRGFTPLVIAKALKDNLEDGEVVFIDPSFVDDFWRDPERVKDHFLGFGIDNIRHFQMTTQQFVTTTDYRSMGQIGLLFIDGRHTEEQASFDYEAFSKFVQPRGFVILHDSMIVRNDKVYGEENAYPMSVKNFVDKLKLDPSLQVIDFPFGHTGMTLLRKVDGEAGRNLHDWLDDGPNFKRA